MTVFYGYVDYTSDGRPFYVGKGTESRIQNKKRNRKHASVSKKYGRKRVVEFASKNESAVFEWEVDTIRKLGTFKSHLGCNFTEGGEGASGNHHGPKVRRRSRARTRAALAVIRARGHKTGGGVPFGYTVGDDGRTLVAVEGEQATIARARALAAEGRSLRAVAAELAHVGRVSRTGRPFAAPQIARMLASVEAPATGVA